ncbi:hypothetical protein ROTO_23240 [Roseovarius tolerans]|jgi:ElaB/YqjD/DUF883 family membrane-anchored ribosome-binding protein|uniref:Membrane-anchored ribosome-binding protein, inhibits growth in stationary phase, ElaB/YqjD/DUF883 family n=1 Tax=Roseovarius tolerans TaxID=74031 RepID=A0A0L6CTL1_9RHOB|nr:DUF883 family protein [Roseovarius tolerans]KNX41114.1 hypothetical protein ROTO_23240 [Roseovarius tolerans]SEM48233.1 Membrane-anchored ribosome-binding protein, inhibits growth in stationary phase, ElaB/YqjD/DUF883 family [Roseovarius tolerans]
MAQSRTTDASPQKDIDQLSEQITTLRQDISDISQTLSGLGRSSRDAATEQARQKAADLRDAGQRQMHNAQYRAEEMGQQAADQVRNQPAAAVGLAVGLGFLLGFMTGRK